MKQKKYETPIFICGVQHGENYILDSFFWLTGSLQLTDESFWVSILLVGGGIWLVVEFSADCTAIRAKSGESGCSEVVDSWRSG